MTHLLDSYETALRTLEENKRKEQGLATLVNDIKKSYERRISALQDEMSDSVREAENNRDAQVGQLNESAVPHKTTISNVKRIMKFIDLLRQDNTLWNPEVYTYSNHDENGKYIYTKRKITFDPICTILSDEYNALNLYIVPNKKPVNKFSLVIRGYSIFAKMDLFRARYGSISGIHDGECNIYVTVKDASTEKELLAYVESSMEKIKNSIPKECIVYASEYEDAKEKFQDKRWQLFYWEYQKENYEKHVSRGTEDPEYSKILKRIRDLKSQALR
jgi:hypothetical protein